MVKEKSIVHRESKAGRMVFFREIYLVDQSSIIPQKTIAKVQSIAYNFIWGKHRQVAWEDKARPEG